ncbi:MAG: trypsin-like peptidase domain-containing protein [Planctomycetota bacterium]|nr:trypsin-like peptidase domain-containing protein [Planctomycetota bacterium]
MKFPILGILFSSSFLPLLACQASGPSVALRTSTDESLEEVFDRVHGSVVTIRTVGQSGLIDDTGAALFEGGIGSGVLVSDDGRIMTAAHVVQTADAVAVDFVDGTTRKARILGTVPSADLALIQIEGELPAEATVARLADSDSARVGSMVFVIGAPRGISHTLTVGHLSARRQLELPFPGSVPIELLQTDAAINKGNSGGPMFDMRGEVIGIVSHIVSESGGSEGLGFGVAANTARVLLLERNIVWSGIDKVVLSGPFARALNLPEGRSGDLVQRVAKGSLGDRLGVRGGEIPATIAGQDLLLGGDVVLEVFGVRVEDPDFYSKVEKMFESLGDSNVMSVLVLRGGDQQLLEGKLGDLVDR